LDQTSEGFHRIEHWQLQADQLLPAIRQHTSPLIRESQYAKVAQCSMYQLSGAQVI
jgi:hypothetical protein